MGTGRLLTTSEQSEGVTGESLFHRKQRTEASARVAGSIVGVGTRVLTECAVHDSEADVVQLVSEERKACGRGGRMGRSRQTVRGI